MRDIKFRGIIKNGWFAYGFLSIGQDSFFIEQRHDVAPTMQDPCGDCVVTRDRIYDPKTIGQFTGLKDKNGVDIYEGDIISACFQWGCVGGNVIYDETACSFGIEGPDKLFFSEHDHGKWVVEGNIHQKDK